MQSEQHLLQKFLGEKRILLVSVVIVGALDSVIEVSEYWVPLGAESRQIRIICYS